MSKVMSIRIDADQEEKLQTLGKQLRNSDAGVIRLGIDLLHQSLVEKGALVIPPLTPHANSAPVSRKRPVRPQLAGA